MDEERRKTRSDFETDSEWYTYKVTHKEKEEEDIAEEEEKYDEYGIFQCMNCGEIIDEFETKPDITKPLKDRLKCPKCGKRKFKKITKEKKKLLLKEIEKKKKREKEKRTRNAEIEREKFEIEIKDLLEDLRGKLFDNKISPNQFVNIFLRISFIIARTTLREVPIDDWLHFQKLLLSMSDDVMKTYDINIDCETEYQNCKENMEQNELYIAYLKKYEESDRYSLGQYELGRRVEDYETELKVIELENEKSMRFAQKIEEKNVDRTNKSFQKELEKNVKKNI